MGFVEGVEIEVYCRLMQSAIAHKELREGIWLFLF